MATGTACPIWPQHEATARQLYSDSGAPRSMSFYECATCGSFEASYEATVNLKTIGDSQRVRLSWATRNASEAGTPLRLLAEDVDRLATSVKEPGGPLAKVDLLVQLLASRGPRLGEAVTFNPRTDWPVCFAHDHAEAMQLVGALVERGFAKPPGGFHPTHGGKVTLTVKGWERQEALSGVTSRRGRAEARPASTGTLPRGAAPGKRFGEWITTGDSLGGGGQGDVHSARRAGDSSGTLFALKRLRNPSRIGRFRNEIEAALRLEHPNIVRVVDHSLEEPAYLVMEYCARKHLTQEMLEPLSLGARLEVFATICKAFAHAHDRGITHRDVKPENILVREDESIAVSDFGVCHIKDAPRDTETGENIRNWMCEAPELEDGRDDNVSPAADIYCLGKLLHWMLSGQKFGREKHREARFDLTLREPRVAHTLVYELLDRMIQADRTIRLQSAAEVLPELDRLIVRVKMNAHAVDLDAPQPCGFCGLGQYQIAVDPRHWVDGGNRSEAGSQIFKLGLGLQDHAAYEVLVLLCDYCGNTQIFKPGKAVQGYKGKLGNWTPKSMR